MFLFAGAEAAESRRGGSTMRRSLHPAARSGGRWAYSEEPLAEIDFSPTADIWQKETGFVPVGKTTPNSRLQEIRAATQEVLARIAPLTHAETDPAPVSYTHLTLPTTPYV